MDAMLGVGGNEVDRAIATAMEVFEGSHAIPVDCFICHGCNRIFNERVMYANVEDENDHRCFCSKCVPTDGNFVFAPSIFDSLGVE